MIELPIALVLFASAIGVGRYVLAASGVAFRNGPEELCFSAVSGLGLLAYLFLLVGLAHLLYATVIYVVLAVWAVFGLFQSYRFIVSFAAPIQRGARVLASSPVYAIISGLAMVAFFLSVTRALAPPHGATDPLAYQLALPKIFLLKHHLSFEPTITGALYPSFVGILFLIGISLQNGILAQLIHLFLGALCVVAICSFCKTYFSLRIGIWAGTIFSFVPILVVFGSQGYVDVGLCFFQFMAFWALIGWVYHSDQKMLVLAGLTTGLALGTKHQGMPTLLLGVAAILMSVTLRGGGASNMVRNVGIFIAAAATVVGPWYVRAYVEAGNPIWPVGNSLFENAASFGLSPTFGQGGKEEGISLFRELIPSLSWFTTYRTSMSPWAWTFSPIGWQKAIGVYFISLVPGILFIRRGRLATSLIMSCGIYYVILIRFLHMNPRYALVLFAFLSVLAGIVAEHLSSNRNTGVSNVFKIAFVATLCLNIAWCFAMARSTLDVALGRESREHFLQKTESNYGLYKVINENLDENATVLLQGIVKGYYCNREYLWDHPHQDVLRYERHRTAEELYARMDALNITHVARMINIPPSRTYLGYPQYFRDDFHEDFRRKYLRLVWRDQFYALFSLVKRPSV